MKDKKIHIVKIISLAIILIICIALIIYLFPVIMNISKPEGQMAFKEKVTNSGIWGLLLLFGLEIAQIFLVVLPGEPLEILAGMCYGRLFRNTILNILCFYYYNNNFLCSKKIWQRIYLSII